MKFLIVIGASFFSCITPPIIAGTINWQQLARIDLASTQQYLQNDSAGGADRENPAFQQWLIKGYQQAFIKTTQVHSASSYNLLMNFYVNGFHDEHIVYNPYITHYDVTYSWPGFTVYYKNKAFYVSTLAYQAERTDLPAKKARLISCDGFTPKQLMQARVFPYFGNVHLEASWHLNAPRLFFYQNNPWFRPLKACIFATGKMQTTYDLHWQELSTQRAFNLRQLASYTYHGETMSEDFLNHQAIWVSLPQFRPNNDVERTALKTLLIMAPAWRHKKLIVIDTRGNHGGNSLWGSQLLQHLYGKDYFKQETWRLKYPRYQWRVCTGNVAELQNFYLPMIKKDETEQPDDVAELEKLIQQLLRAEKNHLTYYPADAREDKAQTAPQTQIANPVSAKIFWLTDGRCASACLTFGDHLMQFPNVTQVGQPTHADTNYTELRTVRLPSGGHLYLPMKVQRGRLRKSNEAYVPTTGNFYRDDIDNTHDVKRWLIKKFVTEDGSQLSLG